MRDLPKPSRRTLLAGLATGTVGISGCTGILNGGESFDCMEISLTGGGVEYRMGLEYREEERGERNRLVTGRSTDGITRYVPEDCEESWADTEELPSIRTPISVSVELGNNSDVGPDSPITAALTLDDERVDSADITEVGESVSLEYP